MTDNIFLKRLFQAYYTEKAEYIPSVTSFKHREFGFIPWDKQIMVRHLGFENGKDLKQYFSRSAPRHAYNSGALYSNPNNQDMGSKDYLGCDLIFDIDVDHFYTPCKEDHDYWFCLECGATGSGIIEKCPSCKKLKFKKITWICSKCLDTAKNEIKKLVFDFLKPDFAIDEKNMKIAFSGHRGYHLKIEEERIRTLSSDERREIVEYITGENISFEILGLRAVSQKIYGILKNNMGWSNKLVNKIEEILQKPDKELKLILTDKNKFGLTPKMAESLITYKQDFLNTLSGDQRNVWAIEGFGIQSWRNFLRKIADEVGVEVDVPVSIDLHRLIRYPGSLHGKTGFKVQEIRLDYLDEFDPLDEQIKKLDPVVFKSEKNITHKVEITAEKVPITVIKGETFGPYNKGEKVDVPHHIAVFLLCKGVVKTI